MRIVSKRNVDTQHVSDMLAALLEFASHDNELSEEFGCDYFQILLGHIVTGKQIGRASCRERV